MEGLLIKPFHGMKFGGTAGTLNDNQDSVTSW